MKMIFKNKHGMVRSGWIIALCMACLLYTSDAADD